MERAFLGAVILALLAGSAARAESSADDILKAVGLRGGLIVHLGCGDGKLTAALRADDGRIVEGLDVDPKNVARARAHVQSVGLGGSVTAGTFDGRHLVNLMPRLFARS